MVFIGSVTGACEQTARQHERRVRFVVLERKEWRNFQFFAFLSCAFFVPSLPPQLMDPLLQLAVISSIYS